MAKTLDRNPGDGGVSAATETRLDQIRRRLPVPVFWLFGKAQSGKTSLIRTLTGNTRAEIGDGIRPCTRTAYVYDFPDLDHSLLRFLDTRGLGEVDYDPAEDLAAFQDQAHLLIVVVKAMDHAQQAVVDALKTITQARPDWPVIVVQTTLHEGYPDPAMEHPLPYPFASEPWAEDLPRDLLRSLQHQRTLFRDYSEHFVAVDFTLPEDGYQPEDYGLEALWDTIETVLPLGLARLMEEAGLPEGDRDDPSRAARPHIIAYALLAAGAGAVPLPLVGVPLVTAVQAKLFQTIARLYDQPMNWQRLSEFGSTLGLGLLAQLGRRELVKLIPGYGSAVSAIYAAATTFALGQTLCVYFERRASGEPADRELFRQIYAEQFQEGQRLLRDYLQQRYGRNNDDNSS